MKLILAVLGFCIVLLGARNASAETIFDTAELPGHFRLLYVLEQTHLDPALHHQLVLQHYQLCVLVVYEGILKQKNFSTSIRRTGLRNIMAVYAIELRKYYPDGALFFYRCAKELDYFTNESLDQMFDQMFEKQ